jgi:hypothetical protein
MGFEADGTFKKLYDFILSDNIQHLFHYLLYEVKVKDWKVYNRGRAPITDALVIMQEENLHPTIQKLSRALKENLSPFDNHFPGYIVLDDLLEFIREKWKTQINEKYVKDWLRAHGLKWHNSKLTRQMLIPATGERPRVWLLKDEDRLRDLSETELGTFTDKGWADNVTDKLNYSFNAESKAREKLFKHIFKIAAGERADKNLDCMFYEDLLMNLYSEDEQIKKISRKFKTENPTIPGGENRINGKSLITFIRKIRKASKKEKEKIIKEFLKNTKYKMFNLPSEYLWKEG